MLARNPITSSTIISCLWAAACVLRTDLRHDEGRETDVSFSPQLCYQYDQMTVTLAPGAESSYR